MSLHSAKVVAGGAAALGLLIASYAQAADEIDVFAVTSSVTAVLQSSKNATIGGLPDTLLVAKPVTLSANALINLAQGKAPTTTLVAGQALGLTCEPSPRLIVLQKNSTAIGDESLVTELGVIGIDGMGVIHEKVVTADGFSYPDADYFVELGSMSAVSPAPTQGFAEVDLNLAIKNTQPTSPSDLFPECPLKFEVTNMTGEMAVKFNPALPTGETELVYLVTKGTLSAARIRIGTLDAPP
jgi:hypothetical protein